MMLFLLWSLWSCGDRPMTSNEYDAMNTHEIHMIEDKQAPEVRHEVERPINNDTPKVLTSQGIQSAGNISSRKPKSQRQGEIVRISEEKAPRQGVQEEDHPHIVMKKDAEVTPPESLTFEEEVIPEQKVPSPAEVVAEHTQWDALLQKYVSPTGDVNYSGFKKVEDDLDRYLEHLASYPPSEQSPKWEAMAYWINLYNAATVKLILKNFPVKSIMDIEGGKAWDMKWIHVGNQSYSLNQVEHEILRKKYPDARVHFAVNCAARSCPPLYHRAYNGNNLDAVLRDRATSFVNNNDYNQIGEKSISVSKIFDWYKEDFGDLIAYINQFSRRQVSDRAKVTFLEYDWGLNGR